MHPQDYQTTQEENKIEEHPEIAEMREQAWKIHNFAKRQIAEVKTDRTLSEQGKKEKLDSITATYNPQIEGKIEQAQKFYHDKEVELKKKLRGPDATSQTELLKQINFKLEKAARESKFLEQHKDLKSEGKIIDFYEEAVNLDDRVMMEIVEEFAEGKLLLHRNINRFENLRWNTFPDWKKKTLNELNLLQKGRDILGLMSWPTPLE